LLNTKISFDEIIPSKQILKLTLTLPINPEIWKIDIPDTNTYGTSSISRSINLITVSIYQVWVNHNQDNILGTTVTY